ncbi:type II secretion system minor pseudopilin GspH [Enterobacter chuandaensis]|uniref:type II secretion system minor pseudopilin GspH n=1 Tax=Enterobacter chuandaensis TaxID=2497875 RepID=UPI00292DEC17
MERQKGFTLLEVMLVVAIIAVMASIIVSSQNARLSETGRLRQKVDAFRQIVEFAADEALLENTAIGIRVTQEGWFYAHPKYDPHMGWRWVEIEKADSLHLTGHWLDGFYIEIAPASEYGQPQIVITPDGQLVPFTLTFRDSDRRRVLTLASEGSLPLTLTVAQEQP